MPVRQWPGDLATRLLVRYWMLLSRFKRYLVARIPAYACLPRFIFIILMFLSSALCGTVSDEPSRPSRKRRLSLANRFRSERRLRSNLYKLQLRGDAQQRIYGLPDNDLLERCAIPCEVHEAHVANLITESPAPAPRRAGSSSGPLETRLDPATVTEMPCTIRPALR